MVTDLRQALRVLLTSPGFTAMVVGVLALGVGANTAIFSIVNGVLLRPLPFADASRLVAISTTVRGTEDGSASFPDFVDWRTESKTMDAMAAVTSYGVTMTGRGQADSLQVALVTSDLMPLLGVRPLLGRVFTAADDAKGAEPVVVISESTWEHRLGRQTAPIGASVTLDGKPFTIVGVLPAAFQYPIQTEGVEAWLPIRAVPLAAQWADQRTAHFLHVIGRLAPGATLQQAQTELETISQRLANAYPQSNKTRGAIAHLLQDYVVRNYRLALSVLLSAVAAVLLIACANVANLLLARSTVRQTEMAIRAALGASRRRIIRQLLTESVAVAVAGGALGVVVAVWLVAGLVAASPVEIPRLRDVTVDRSGLLFTMLVSMATGVLFGLAPAVHASRADAGETLKQSGRSSSGSRSARTRRTLVVVEVALSFVLLACAGLLIRSLGALQRVDPGFVPEHAIATELSLPAARYPDVPSQLAFYRRLLDGTRAMPGTIASGIATTLPLSGSDLGIGFSIEGRPQEPGTRTSAAYFAVSPDYFRAMGIRLVRGRVFSERDNQQAANVAIISETFARRFWPDDNPLGKRLSVGYNQTGPREIVGVVADVKQIQLAEKPQPEVYTPFPQTPWPFLAIVVRTQGEPAAAVNSLRSAVTKLDPNQAVGDVKMVTAYLARSVATPRFTAVLVSGFAAFALLLAGFGLFSVIAYGVAQRRREIGIRMALGAQPADVRSLVLSQALWMTITGLAIGLLGALAMARVLDTLLFGVTRTDPTTFVAAPALLVGVILLAAYLPARRATRLDPVSALRTE
jgi:putative ABC transport system permease protein